jgi:small subunit ribosomal protein S20
MIIQKKGSSGRMPNIKSAKKRVKVIQTKTARNKAIKSDLKTALKKADAAVIDNADNKEEVVKAAIKKVDMACTKGIMHKNKAARKKSQLAKKLG